MRASEAAWLLAAIGRGERLEVEADLGRVLDGLEAAGLVREAPDPGGDRRTMEAMKADLARIAAARAAGDTSPATLGRERGLRSAVIELSERLAVAEGAAVVVRHGAALGPFRGGGGGTRRLTLTQPGRALSSDLGLRAARLGPMSLADFQQGMEALRVTLASRVARAQEIARALGSTRGLGRAVRSVPLGLAAVRGQPTQIARAFDVTFGHLRRAGTPYSVEQDAAAAELLCLAVGDPDRLARLEPARAFDALRDRLAQVATPGLSEDALDAATLLVSVPPSEHEARIALARELAAEIARHGTRLTLSLALVALAGERTVPPHLAATLGELDRSLAAEVPDGAERIATAVLLVVPRGDPRAQLERWRLLRSYLGRFSADGMAIAASLLAWVALDPPELLDDLRMVSAELTRRRMVEGAAETVTHGIKVLLGSAALAAGAEGDPEEALALGPRAGGRLARIGLHGALSTLPLATAAVTAFHGTVLDAALAWEERYRPTHSHYVFGSTGRGHRSWGYG